MSVTAIETTSFLEHQLGRIQFIEPDTTVDPWDCDYLAMPKPLKLSHEILPLNDLRPDVFSKSSPYKLSTTGFTAVKHLSALHSAPYSKSSFMDEELVEKIYIPEIKDLVKSVTGAKSAYVISVALRLREAFPTPKTTAEKKADPPTEPERCGIKIDLNEIDLAKPFFGGYKPEQMMGPARAVHIDYSPTGAGKMLRCYRNDITDDVGDIISAEDQAAASNTEYTGRRYALFSIWRPLKTVMRDPIAVCDGSTIDPKNDLVEHVYKHVTKKPYFNSFSTEVHILQGNNAKSQKWYYIKNQNPDEVLFIQFFDSHADKEGRPVGAPHGSPEILDMDGEIRESCEVRCLAVW